MDRNLHTDDFERLLREKSDEFRMYPSKRIWYSIYNNIHPGRKWPSVVMGIVLITSLLLIGYLNTNNLSYYPVVNISKNNYLRADTSNDITSKYTAAAYNYQPFPEYLVLYGKKAVELTGNSLKPILNNFPDPQRHTILPLSDADKTSFPQRGAPSQSSQNTPLNFFVDFSKTDNIVPKKHPLERVILGDKDSPTAFISSVDKMIPSGLPTTAQKVISNVNIEKIEREEFANEYFLTHIIGGKEINPLSDKGPFQHLEKQIENNTITKEDKNWIENYALYNRPFPKKWAGKLSWDMYVTPSVVYRQLNNAPDFSVVSTSAPFVLPAVRNINKDVVQKASAGLEIGVALKYAVFKGVKITTGLQLNFTRYNSHGYYNNHPVATKLTMNDYVTRSTYESFRTTPYSNKSGVAAVKFHNETWQISLPVGAEVKLGGDKNLQWNAGVTLQPTFVAGGKSYLISSDRRNYVKETGMLRRLNLNAGFETFISFKANGIIYQLGPQIRTQLFSTNSKKYAVEEKLVSYGIKFGVVKTLK